MTAGTIVADYASGIEAAQGSGDRRCAAWLWIGDVNPELCSESVVKTR